MMKAVRTSETSVNFNVTTQRYIPEDSKLHTRRRENLKSHIFLFISPPWVLHASPIPFSLIWSSVYWKREVKIERRNNWFSLKMKFKIIEPSSFQYSLAMKMAVFWDVAPCHPLEIYRRLRGPYCLHNHGNRPETSVNFCETTRSITPADSLLHILRRKNLKSYLLP
jgi:hypothetical protein